jgi:hypothetical protein
VARTNLSPGIRGFIFPDPGPCAMDECLDFRVRLQCESPIGSCPLHRLFWACPQGWSFRSHRTLPPRSSNLARATSESKELSPIKLECAQGQWFSLVLLVNKVRTGSSWSAGPQGLTGVVGVYTRWGMGWPIPLVSFRPRC